MPCDWLKGPNGETIHIKCGRGRKQQCPFCKQGWVSKLCDFPVGHGKTCDSPMCDGCATRMGRQETKVGSFTRPNDTKDYCPIHKGQPEPSEAAA